MIHLQTTMSAQEYQAFFLHKANKMATLQFGPLVTDARGSIRGTTFSRSLAGATARARPRPARPSRPWQAIRQLQLASAAARWRLLTTADQDDWNDYGATVTLLNRLGVAFNPTGQMMFVRQDCFNWRSTAGPATPVIPTASSLPFSPACTFALSGDDLQVASVTPALAADEKLFLTIYSPSTQPQGSRRTYRSAALLTSATALPHTISSGFASGIGSALRFYGRVTAVFRDADYRTGNLAAYDLTLTAP